MPENITTRTTVSFMDDYRVGKSPWLRGLGILGRPKKLRRVSKLQNGAHHHRPDPFGI